MAREYFNHHATRVAIEMSVELDEETQWTGTGFFVQVSGRLEEGPTIDCLLLISNKHVLVEGVGMQGISLNKKIGSNSGTVRAAGLDRDRSRGTPLYRAQGREHRLGLSGFEGDGHGGP